MTKQYKSGMQEAVSDSIPWKGMNKHIYGKICSMFLASTKHWGKGQALKQIFSPGFAVLFSRLAEGTLHSTPSLSSWHLLHRCAIYLGNHLVSVRDNSPGFIVFLYSSKGANQHSYPNENLGDKNRDDQQKKPGAEAAPARESPPKPVPHWRPTPEETPGTCKCQRNVQNGSGSALRDRPKGRDDRDGSDNACKDPYSNGAAMGSRNFFT
jgi:hypothetical protein